MIRTHLSGRKLLFACLTALVLTGAARADIVVVPNALTDVDPPGATANRFPLLVTGGIRYQQVYAASEFASFGGPQTITQIAFRPDAIFGSPAFTANIANIEVRLSTTSANPDGLSPTFANNLGADNTLVFSGPLTITSNFAPGPGNTRDFDVIIPLQTPFTFNPALGNLLLDVRNLSGTNITNRFFDAPGVGGDPVSRLFGPEGNPNALTGTADTIGLVTQFVTAQQVPEPGTLALFGLGALGLVGYRRRK